MAIGDLLQPAILFARNIRAASGCPRGGGVIEMTEFFGVEESDEEFKQVLEDLNTLPWIVWHTTLLDPENLLDEGTVAEQTQDAATKAARRYGCVYEECVDDDWMPDGTKYYMWRVGITQAEHRRLMGNTPVVLLEVLGALFSVLPEELRSDRLWTHGPDIYATRIRNHKYGGYPGTNP